MVLLFVGFFFFLYGRTERNEVMKEAEAAAEAKKEGKTLDEVGFDFERAQRTLQAGTKKVLIALIVMSIGAIWVLGAVAYVVLT